jgi:uncharacterized protein YhaN
VFAVNVDDLQSLDALTDDELNDLVFSAGVVGAGRSATAAIDLLDRQRNELYRPRGRVDNYAVLHLRKELRDAEERLGGARQRAASVAGLRRSFAATEAEAVELRGEVARLDARLRHLCLLLELWPSAVEATAAARELEARAEGVVVPPSVVTRLEGLLATAAETAAAAEVARSEVAEAVRRAEVLRPDQALLDAGPAVDDLSTRAAVVARDRGDIAALRARVSSATNDLAGVSAALGGHVDLDGLASEQVDLVHADALAGRATGLQRSTDALERATAARLAAEHERDEQVSRLTARLDALRGEGPSEVDAIDERVSALDDLALLFAARADAGASGGRAPASVPAWLPGVVLAAGATFAVAVIVSLVVVSVAAGVLLLVGALLLAGLAVGLRRSSLATVAPVDTIPGPALAARAAAAGLASPDPQAVRAALVRARRERDERLARANALAAAERERAETVAATAARVAAATEAERQAQEAVEVAARSWSAWLLAHDLPADLAPEGAARFLEAMRAAHSLLAEAAACGAQADGLAATVAAFDDEVRSLTERLSRPVADQAGATLEVLAHEVAAARAVAVERRQADLQVAAKVDAARAAEARRETAEVAVAQLLAKAGCASVDALRAAAEATAVRAGLAVRVEGFEGALALAAGATRVADVRADLATGDPAAWHADVHEAEAARASAEDRRDRLVDEAGALRRRLEEVERSSDVAALVLEVEGWRAELQAALRRWMVLGLARGLVSETLAQYQRERQPRVLARAQQLFALVTEGRYPQLRTDDRAVIAVDAAGRDVVASSLSRGAREQLYLCLRFALAESFGERAALPIILDDVLVNFDPARAAQVAAVVAEVAEHHQVLAFTCHPWVRDLLVGAAPTATELVFDSPSGELVPIRHGQSPAAGSAAAS